MSDTPRQIRSKQIAIMVARLSRHYGVSCFDIASREVSKNPKVMSARYLLTYHLHECGMSYEMIAKMNELSVKTVGQHRAQGKRLVLNGMRDFVDELPRVTSTLEILRK